MLINQKHDGFYSFKEVLKFEKFLYLPNTNFFENNETFITTEGFIKKMAKLVFRSKTKSNWQLIRKLREKSVKNNFTVNNIKDRKLISFNNTNLSNFKNFLSFHFYATKTITNISFLLNIKNTTFVIYKKFTHFKNSSRKLLETKNKYWMDNFYTGGKDRLCNNSIIMINCSQNLKLQTTNFF